MFIWDWLISSKSISLLKRRQYSLQFTSLAFQRLVIEVKVILQVLKHFHLLFHILKKKQMMIYIFMTRQTNFVKNKVFKILDTAYSYTSLVILWRKLTCTRFLMSWRLCSRICCFSVTTVPVGCAACPSYKRVNHILTLEPLCQPN